MENLHPSAAAYTVTLTVDDTANYYDDDQKQDEVEVYIIDGLTVFPSSAKMCVGTTNYQFEAWDVVDDTAQNVTTDCTWSTDVPGASINQNGLFSAGNTGGTGVVRAEKGEESDTADVTVIKVVITGPSFVCKGDTKQMNATGTPTGGTFSNWLSSNTAVATINSSTGQLTGVSAGTTNVTVDYTYSGHTCTSPGFAVKVVEVDITSADVTQDKIHINLGPGGLSGTLKLWLTGPGTSHTIREVTRSSGSYDETFNIPNLATGEYTKVNAKWTVQGVACSDEYDYHIKVLGDFDQTWYNAPVESHATCQGADQTVCITNSQCQYTPNVDMEQEFVAETLENGTGNATDYAYVKKEQWCQTHGYPAPEECQGKEILREVSSVKGKCDQTLTANQDVAADYEEVPDLPCGTTIYIHTIGVRTVRDFCPGCGTTKIDNYYGESGCDQVPGTLYDKKVIILY